MADADPSTRRTLYAMSRSGVADVLLTVYFMGAVIASGIAGLVAPGELGSLFAGISGGLVLTAYSWAMVAVGVAGIGARLADSRMAEFYAITGVSILTVINGIALLPEHPQAALRLTFAPAMMMPYAWMRLGYTVPRAEVHSIRAAVADADADPGQKPTR